jgi:osmotically inducible protein OsmC
MAAKRRAEVMWENDLVKGKGRIRFGTEALPETAVTWASRTDKPEGTTSPEELLAAAHASCYAMALSATLVANRTPPTRLEVGATCTLDEVGGKWKVTLMELTAKGVVHGIDNSNFVEIAKKAEAGCPISNALRNNVKIKLSASLMQ